MSIILGLGPILGFCMFLINTTTVGKIYFRPDSDNIDRFTLINLWNFIKTPLKIKSYPSKILWGLTPNISLKTRLQMLSMNWIFMTALGTLPALIFVCI